MKNFLSQVITVLLGSGLFAEPSLAVRPGDLLPQITAKGIVSGQLDNAALKDKVTVINFWATWCEACKVELREMEAIFAPLFKEPQFRFAFVSLDKEPENAAKWVKDNLTGAAGLATMLYIDPSFAVAETLAVDAFPMTLLIGKSGRVEFIQKGFKAGEGSTEKLAERVRNLLKS